MMIGMSDTENQKVVIPEAAVDRITDEAVEAAARALWQVHPLTRENIRSATRRALRAAAPHILNRNDEDGQFYEKGRL